MSKRSSKDGQQRIPYEKYVEIQRWLSQTDQKLKSLRTVVAEGMIGFAEEPPRNRGIVEG